MENKEEDAICRRWEQEARDKALREQRELGDRPRKRPREIEYSHGDLIGFGSQRAEASMVTLDEETVTEARSTRVAGKAKAKAKAKAGAPVSTSVRGSRAKGRITEISEGEEECIELS